MQTTHATFSRGKKPLSCFLRPVSAGKTMFPAEKRICTPLHHFSSGKMNLLAATSFFQRKNHFSAGKIVPQLVFLCFPPQ